MNTQRLRNIFTFFIFTTLIFILVPARLSLADPLNDHTVRVAYPIQTGLTDKDKTGRYFGYTYEYLEEIAQYTGWDYEFVEVPGTIDESLETLMGMLKNGEIDLMGGLLYSTATGQTFDFSSHSYGTAETILQVSSDTDREIIINSQIPQTMRIAALSNSIRLKQELEDYFAMNLVTPVYVDCDTEEELLAALREGRADAILNTSMNYIPGMRTIARFASKPFYFVTTKGENAELMSQLNSAIMSIDRANPTFSTTLYEKYFAPPVTSLTFSQEELDFIRNSAPLKVGFVENQPPYQYISTDGSLCGISLDLLNYISEKTGLTFEIVTADTPQKLLDMVEEGELQLVTGMPYNYDLARASHLAMTQPYINSLYILLMNGNGDVNSPEKPRYALTTYSSFTDSSAGELLHYATIEQCINALVEGEADYAYVDTYSAHYYMNKPEYRGLKLVPQTSDPRSLCFGIVKPGHQLLLSIFNKVIFSIPETTKQQIINQNTLVSQPLTLFSLIRENPLRSIMIIVAVFTLIIAVLLFFLRQRALMSRKMALELKKHFRVYALVNEYFFEYDLRTGHLVLSVPPEYDGEPKLEEYDRKRLLATPGGQRFIEAITSGDGMLELELTLTDQKEHWIRLAVETICDGSSPAYVIGRVNVIDDEKRIQDDLLQKARLDSLTQLYNAQTCRTMVAESLGQLPQGQLGALILLDIDHFKDINDTYGHLSGDKALTMVAGLLRANFRAQDIAGRPGGDEFTVYLPRIKDLEGLEAKCALLCRKASELDLAGLRPLTISVGAVLSCSGDSYEALYEMADQPLYRSKAQGRNRYEIADRPELRR